MGAPQAMHHPALRTVALITIGLALIFPLAGASLIVVMVADGLVQRLRHPAADPRAV